MLACATFGWPGVVICVIFVLLLFYCSYCHGHTTPALVMLANPFSAQNVCLSKVFVDTWAWARTCARALAGHNKTLCKQTFRAKKGLLNHGHWPVLAQCTCARALPCHNKTLPIYAVCNVIFMTIHFYLNINWWWFPYPLIWNFLKILWRKFE